MSDGKNEVLAIIPARGGSQGIPRKNIVPLCGKPLIAYTIEAALASKSLSRVVVSTDEEEIARIAQTWGAEVPFLRPHSIASSKSLLRDCFENMLNGLGAQGYHPKALVFLFCTSPFRTPAMIDFLTGKILDGHLSVLTVKKIPLNHTTQFFLDSPTPTKALRLAPDYTRHYFRSYGVFSGQNMGPVTKGVYLHCIDDPCMLVDIDTPEDLDLASRIISRGKFNFGLQ